MRFVFSIICIVALLTFPGSAFSAWQPPIGIPYPEFGINETHRMYDGQLFDYDGDGTAEALYKDSGNGPYTHYIDNTHPDATDSNNPYGTAETPRRGLPDLNAIAPGSVLEIHGGPYNSGRFWWTSNGTVEQPIFIRGGSADDRPVFNISFLIRAHHVIIENIEFDRNNGDAGAVSIRPWETNEQVHHVAVRNCEAHNVFPGDGGNGAVMAASGLPDGTSNVHDIVYYNNFIHAGDVPDSPVSYEKDTVGIGFGHHAENIWIVDNEISECMGDAAGAGHGANYTAKNIYVGRNHMHHCGENAVDIKEVDTVVLSQNKMHDFYGTSAGSNGTALVIHYGPEFSPKNVWVLFNEMYNANGSGIQVGGSQEHDVYIVGNIIHDITNESKDAKAYTTWNCEQVFLIGNTIYDVDNGIFSHVQKSTGRLILRNNIISKVDASGYFFSLEGTEHCSTAEIADNLFYQEGGDVRVRWNGTGYLFSDFQNDHPGKCENCIVDDPLFMNADNHNFNLSTEDSPAVNAGKEHAAYQWFYERFGRDISVDFNGSKRPHDTAWDIGAFEYGALPIQPPAAPTGLQIQ